MTPTLAAPRVDRDRAVALFHALSDDTRLAVLELLRDGERCVCELQDALDVAQSRLSFHLRVLRDAGLVTDRKDGRWSYYTMVPEVLGETHDLVRALGTHSAHGHASERKSRAPLRVFGNCCS